MGKSDRQSTFESRARRGLHKQARDKRENGNIPSLDVRDWANQIEEDDLPDSFWHTMEPIDEDWLIRELFPEFFEEDINA